MKKKIEDLTLEEINKICESHKCKECPLLICLSSYKCKDENLELYGEEEIEVEDDER